MLTLMNVKFLRGNMPRNILLRTGPSGSSKLLAITIYGFLRSFAGTREQSGTEQAWKLSKTMLAS